MPATVQNCRLMLEQEVQPLRDPHAFHPFIPRVFGHLLLKGFSYTFFRYHFINDWLHCFMNIDTILPCQKWLFCQHSPQSLFFVLTELLNIFNNSCGHFRDFFLLLFEKDPDPPQSLLLPFFPLLVEIARTLICSALKFWWALALSAWQSGKIDFLESLLPFTCGVSRASTPASWVYWGNIFLGLPALHSKPLAFSMDIKQWM